MQGFFTLFIKIILRNMATIHEFNPEAKYSPLKFLINALYFIAFIVGLGSCYALTMPQANAYTLFIAGVGVAVAFLIVVIAQLIKLLMDMEQQQRHTNNLLAQIITNQKE